VKKRIIKIVNSNIVIIKNLSFLTILKIVSLLIPLITYPYLISVLGTELYGLIIYAQAIVAYFSIIINFGFNISAIKDISIHRNDKNKLSEIVSSVFTIKIILFFICGLLFCMIVFLIPKFRNHYLLFLLSYGLCLGEVLLPVWFYQGIEKMKYMTYVSISSKIFFTIFIFVFITSRDDYLYMPILLSLGSVIGGVISFFLVFIKEKIEFKFQSLNSIISYVKRTIPFFVSRLSSVLSSETNTVIIGAFLGMTDVAYYDLAKKITFLFMYPNTILNTVIYPKIALEKSLVFVKKILRLRIIIALIMYLSLFVFGQYIIDFLVGDSMQGAYMYVVIMGLLILITAISHHLGATVLVSFNYESKFNFSLLFSTVFYLILMGTSVLFNCVTLLGVICIFLSAEIIIASYRFYYCRKYHLI